MATVPAPASPSSDAAGRIPVPTVLLLGFMAGIQVVDPLINSVALVTASKDLHLTGEAAALAATIATIVLAATVVSTGELADRIGRRRVLLGALLVAIAGNLIVSAAPGGGVYLLGRALAGLGLGAVFGCSFAYVRGVVPAARLSAALGIFGATAACTLVVASIVAGFLASHDWRLAFLVMPGLAVVALVLVPRLLPVEQPVAGGPPDVLGQVLLAVGVVGLLAGVSHATTSFVAPLTLAPLGIGLASMAGFVLVELHGSHPFFPIRLLLRPLFAGALIVTLCWNMAQAVLLLQLSNLWQYVDRYTASRVSLSQLPFLLMPVPTFLITGRLLARGVRHRTVARAGLGAAAVGYLSLAAVGQHSPYALFLPALVLVAMGAAMLQVQSETVISETAPAESLGPVTSAKVTVGQFGYALGLAGATAIVSQLTKGGVTRRLLDIGVSVTDVGRGVDDVLVFVRTGTKPGGGLSAEALTAAAPSYVHAFDVTMVLFAVFLIVAAVVVSFFYRDESPLQEGYQP